MSFSIFLYQLLPIFHRLLFSPTVLAGYSRHICGRLHGFEGASLRPYLLCLRRALRHVRSNQRAQPPSAQYSKRALLCSGSVVVKLYALLFARPHNCLLFAEVNLACTMYSIAAHYVDEKRFIEVYCQLVMLDGHHRCRSADIVRSEAHLTWAAKLLCMRDAFEIDGNPFTTAASINPVRIENISTAIMHG